MRSEICHITCIVSLHYFKFVSHILDYGSLVSLDSLPYSAWTLLIG